MHVVRVTRSAVVFIPHNSAECRRNVLCISTALRVALTSDSRCHGYLQSTKVGCAPALDKAFEDAEQDVSIEAPLVRLIQHDYRIPAKLVVLEHLPEQRTICGRQQ